LRIKAYIGELLVGDLYKYQLFYTLTSFGISDYLFMQEADSNRIVTSDKALGLPSAIHSILVVEDGIYEDDTTGTVYGQRYSQIEVPLEREDGTVVCDVSANTDLKFIRRVSSTNRTRLATIYFLHTSDLGAST
jgi:hypothetical protein